MKDVTNHVWGLGLKVTQEAFKQIEPFANDRTVDCLGYTFFNRTLFRLRQAIDIQYEGRGVFVLTGKTLL
jgi:hypothetical protein